MQAQRVKEFLSPANPIWTPVGSNQPLNRVVAHIRSPEGYDEIAAVPLPREIDLLEKPRPDIAPLFVSYFTENTPYEMLADELRGSLDLLGMPHRIEPLPSRGDWVANTCLKAEFIENIWHNSHRPICWIDADAEVLRIPNIVYSNPFDMAVVRRSGWYDMSGFVYFGKTEGGGDLVSLWAKLCRDYPNIVDQVLLTLAWYQVVSKVSFASLWLNEGFFRFPRPRIRDIRDRIFYYPYKRKVRPFINQKQASRKLRSFMGRSKENIGKLESDDLGNGFKSALCNYDFTFKAGIETVFTE